MNPAAQFLNPSDAASQLGISTKALRIYEQRGLITPGRTSAGLESIMAVAGGPNGGDDMRKKTALVVGPRDKTLRRARTCYDHLAGQVAVALADRMVELGFVEFSADGGALTDEGVIVLRGIGVDLDGAAARSSRRGGPIFCRPCLDWSERRSHIAGSVGAAICHACFS